MNQSVQVLSQLLWDLVESSKEQQPHILEQFYNCLTQPESMSLSNPSSSFYAMHDTLCAPLKLILDNPADAAVRYLNYCQKVTQWPFNAFLAALIPILTENAAWAERWQPLTAEDKRAKNSFCKSLDGDVERLYASNISSDIMPAIDAHKKTVQEYYRMRCERENFTCEDCYLINLKGLSSSSPTIYNNTFGTQFRGGGFYFRWNGVGVAVDPGLYFVTNMHEFGLNIQDIQAVVITHNHLDHMGDMQLLDDLEYQIKRTAPIKWYVCEEIYSDKKSNPNFTLVRPGGDYNISNFIQLRTTPARHILDKDTGDYRNTTFGCVFRLSDSVDLSRKRTLGYTSDTTYWSGIEENYEGMDVLIANISSIREKDLLLEEQNPIHLGFTGCVKLLQGLKQPPILLLLSEFWNGIEDIRFIVSKQLWRLSSRKHVDTRVVLPTEIGMRISLKTLGIKCSSCGTYTKRVALVRPNQPFGRLEYLCENCVLSF